MADILQPRRVRPLKGKEQYSGLVGNPGSWKLGDILGFVRDTPKWDRAHLKQEGSPQRAEGGREHCGLQIEEDKVLQRRKVPLADKVAAVGLVVRLADILIQMEDIPSYLGSVPSPAINNRSCRPELGVSSGDGEVGGYFLSG